MKKLSVGGIVLAASLATPVIAHAQTFMVLGPDTSQDRYGSPQHFALELRGGPWLPDVDSEPGIMGCPFARYFSSDSASAGCPAVSDRLMLSAEFDWQALRINYVGSLGLGVSVGYSSLSAAAPVTGGTPGQRSEGQESTLHVLPTYAVAVFRLDVLARRTVIPLVPYVKAGVGAYYWWVTLGGDTVYHTPNLRTPEPQANDRPGTERIHGITTGLHFAAGLMVRLDFLEPRAQRAWDLEMGVNHSYLFAEYTVADMRGQFSSTPSMYLGWKNFTFGLALEF